MTKAPSTIYATLFRPFWYLLLGVFFVVSCRKNDAGPSPKDKLNDEALELARENYLWFDQIPSNFDASAYNDPAGVMAAIRVFSNEPGFTEPVDDFSFAMQKFEWDNLSSGITTDYGLSVFFMNDGDLRVRMVEKASPAGQAGIRRGWQITAVNGNSNISVSNSDYIVSSIYGSSNVSITFRKPDGSSVTLPLVAATYQEEPVVLDTVYHLGSRRVGYMVLGSFLGNINAVKNTMSALFAKFLVKNVTDMVVDLRYNGGGYVTLQQTLANYLIKPSVHGQVMMKEEYNSLHAAKNQTTYFEKLGGLDIETIYFIVSDNTASASELLINNLKPYMNVKLVGEATYGKPVGFFPIEAGDWYTFPVSFRSTNSLGQGNYFNGIAADGQAADGLDRDWGDIQELRLASVLNHLESGNFGLMRLEPGLNSTLEAGLKETNSRLRGKTFRGAIAQ